MNKKKVTVVVVIVAVSLFGAYKYFFGNKPKGNPNKISYQNQPLKISDNIEYDVKFVGKTTIFEVLLKREKEMIPHKSKLVAKQVDGSLEVIALTHFEEGRVTAIEITRNTCSPTKGSNKWCQIGDFWYSMVIKTGVTENALFDVKHMPMPPRAAKKCKKMFAEVKALFFTSYPPPAEPSDAEMAERINKLMAHQEVDIMMNRDFGN